MHGIRGTSTFFCYAGTVSKKGGVYTDAGTIVGDTG